MPRYHCLFVTHADDVFSSDFLEAESDDEAIARALSLYRSGIGKGYEIWRDDELIHTHTH